MAESALMQFPFEKDAMCGAKMPAGLAMHDALMFLGLRSLYSQHRNGMIGREQATAEKRKLINMYRYQKFLFEESKRYVEAIKKTEIARAEYRKNKTFEAADAIVASIEGCSRHNMGGESNDGMPASD